MRAPLMPCALQTRREHHGHVVEPMYTYVSETVWRDVCLLCRSANERRGVSGAGALREEVSDRAHE